MTHSPECWFKVWFAVVCCSKISMKRYRKTTWWQLKVMTNTQCLGTTCWATTSCQSSLNVPWQWFCTVLDGGTPFLLNISPWWPSDWSNHSLTSCYMVRVIINLLFLIKQNHLYLYIFFTYFHFFCGNQIHIDPVPRSRNKKCWEPLL